MPIRIVKYVAKRFGGGDTDIGQEFCHNSVGGSTYSSYFETRLGLGQEIEQKHNSLQISKQSYAICEKVIE